MKKLYMIFAASCISAASYGQAIVNAGMETWRTGTTGGVSSLPVVPIAAPTAWFGLDSLTVNVGQTFAALIGAGPDWKQQVFEETTFKNSGSASAKLVTVKQDTLGFFPSTLSNAAPVFDPGVVAGGGDPQDALSFEGGTATTLRITTVKAWVAYTAGKDASTGAFGGPDQGIMTVQAIATVAGADSAVGTGAVNISPSATFTEVTATVDYSTTDYAVHTLRIVFASGGGLGTPLDSSVLYVDDVSMEGVPQSIGQVTGKDNIFSVFPNPANRAIFLNGPTNGGYSCILTSVDGKFISTQLLQGTDNIDISMLSSGLYVYTITNSDGIAVQNGKVNVTN